VEAAHFFAPALNPRPAARLGPWISAQQSGRIVFNLVDVANNHAAEAPAAVLTVTKDLPPALAITAPDSDALVVTGLTVPVAVEASDDYGLSSLRLHVSVNDTFLPPVSAAFAEALIRRHRLEHPLDLAPLGAVGGDQVVIFAEAIDTPPDPQITRTDVRRFEIITEEDYNDRLREQADVAMLAGKYEALLQRLDEKIQAQRQIEDDLAKMLERAASNPGDAKLLENFFPPRLSNRQSSTGSWCNSPSGWRSSAGRIPCMILKMGCRRNSRRRPRSCGGLRRRTSRKWRKLWRTGRIDEANILDPNAIPGVSPTATYVGSASCAGCHP
jgi:hypothetical protein